MAERDGGHLPMTTDLLMKERGKEGGDWRRRTWSARGKDAAATTSRDRACGRGSEILCHDLTAEGPHTRWE
jgi:hypothetical protein